MGRVATREAVTSFLETAKITNVGKVQEARRVMVNEQDYERNRQGELQRSDAGSSAMLVVSIPSDTRQRYALAGRAYPRDWRKYKVAIEVWFMCKLASKGEADIQAQKDYDAIIDEIVELVRDNPTLNAPSVIWSAGEFDEGVAHHQAMPVTSSKGLAMFISGVVTFTSWEEVAPES